MKDWLVWHEAYDDAASSLVRRLEVVKHQLGLALDGVTATKPRLLSLCAGDGRDVISVLATRAGRPLVTAVLVEKHLTLAHRARAAAAEAGLSSVSVRCTDAGNPDSFSDVLPVDVLMLCGLFGNIEHSAVKDVVDAIPSLVSPGGYVIWTRGHSEPDRRPEIRRWLTSSHLQELAYEGAPEPYGVGLYQQRSTSTPRPSHQIPSPLFTFE